MRILSLHDSPKKLITLCRAAALGGILAIIATGTAFAKSPRVSASAFPATIMIENEEAVYTLSISSPATHNIPVTFVMTGTAIQGFDYVLSGRFTNTGQAVILAGDTSATLVLHPFAGNPLPLKIATLNVINGVRYHIGSPDNASVTIRLTP
jgi:hypothetical protein